MKENAKRTKKGVKIFIGLLFLFLPTLSVQAMNFLSKGLEFMGGYAVPMGNAVYHMFEIPKEEEEQFKEYVTQLNFSSAQDMIQKQIHQLEKDPLLSHDQQVKEVNKKQAFLLYQRLEIAAVTIDYVHACLKSKRNCTKKIILAPV